MGARYVLVNLDGCPGSLKLRLSVAQKKTSVVNKQLIQEIYLLRDLKPNNLAIIAIFVKKFHQRLSR